MITTAITITTIAKMATIAAFDPPPSRCVLAMAKSQPPFDLRAECRSRAAILV